MLPSLIARLWLVVRLYDDPDLKLFILVGWDPGFLSVAWPTGVHLVFFLLLKIFSDVVWGPGISTSGSLLYFESSFLIQHGGYHDLFVCPRLVRDSPREPSNYLHVNVLNHCRK